jgi:7-cyano-7-deazaguanine synthase
LTYIPSRNAIFFGIASYYAEIYGATYIVTGHNLEDPFPDSKPTYIKAMNVALFRGSWLGKRYKTRIVTPLGSAEKAAILKLGARLRAPLALTWSCHRNRKTPCGKCSGCISRSKAFKELKPEDDRRSRIRRL